MLDALHSLDPKQTEGQIAIDDASYFLSKLELVRGHKRTMAKWRKRLFISHILHHRRRRRCTSACPAIGQ